MDGQDANGAFTTDLVTLPNIFTVGDGFTAWEGWAISSITDNETPGFDNQFSAIPGMGNADSPTYAVSFNFGQNIMQINNGPQVVEGLYITNSTFAFLSMRDGDTIAKRFGGATGDDPDFFVVNIEGFRDGEAVDTMIEFFLADFRFEDNAQDFILDEWTFLDLSAFGEVDSLGFTLNSSDVGQFGLNTPAYFCIDDIQLSSATTTSTVDIDEVASIDLFPNPTSDFIQIRGLDNRQSLLNIYSSTGQRVASDLMTLSLIHI